MALETGQPGGIYLSKLGDRIILKKGEEKSISTPQGELQVNMEDGRLYYRRETAGEPDNEIVEKSFLLGRQSKQITLAYLPVYPDRPLIFRLTDNLTVPPGEKGFFSLQFQIGIGLTILETDTLVEEMLPKPRKNSYWGPPTGGILAYQYKSPVAENAPMVAHNTGPLIAVVPVNFINNRDIAQEVTRCLIPLRELDIYKTQEDELVFEAVQLIQQEENDQVPKPLKRPPRGFGPDLKRLTKAPNKPQSLLEKVSVFSGWQQLSGVFVDK